jgi:hypothetical protein
MKFPQYLTTIFVGHFANFTAIAGLLLSNKVASRQQFIINFFSLMIDSSKNVIVFISGNPVLAISK